MSYFFETHEFISVYPVMPSDGQILHDLRKCINENNYVMPQKFQKYLSIEVYGYRVKIIFQTRKKTNDEILQSNSQCFKSNL